MELEARMCGPGRETAFKKYCGHRAHGTVGKSYLESSKGDVGRPAGRGRVEVGLKRVRTELAHLI